MLSKAGAKQYEKTMLILFQTRARCIMDFDRDDGVEKQVVFRVQVAVFMCRYSDV